MTTRCVIVDDGNQFRAAGGQLLHGGGMAVVGMAPNSAEALAGIDTTRPDVALVDVRFGSPLGRGALFGVALPLARRIRAVRDCGVAGLPIMKLGFTGRAA